MIRELHCPKFLWYKCAFSLHEAYVVFFLYFVARVHQKALFTCKIKKSYGEDAPRHPYKVSILNYVAFLASCEFALMILSFTIETQYLSVLYQFSSEIK